MDSFYAIQKDWLALYERLIVIVRQELEPKPTEPVAVAAGSIEFSANGFLVYQNAGQLWCCELNERERPLVEAILAAPNQVLDGNDAYALYKLDSWRDGRKMNGIVGSINRKFKRWKIPIKVKSEEYQYRLIQR